MHTNLPVREERPWWRDAVTYQIYIRSYADSNGDGIGDINGIRSRLPYLKELGVDCIWINPWFASPQKDHGYDVADYMAINPDYGTMDDAKALIKEAHASGIRIILDLVPNHTSDQHKWFQAALNSEPGSKERDRYIFRDGKGKNGELPPNNWEAVFGGCAWERVIEADGKPGQWYLHLFAPEQPDFNWKNADVRADFEKTIRFWADRGVDGFRVDVAHSLAKEIAPPYPDYPNYTPESIPVDGSHQLFDRDELMEIYKDWRKVFNSYDPPKFAVAEANAPVERRGRYAKEETLGQAFSFELLETAWDAEKYLKVITTSLKFAELNKSTTTWTLS